MLVVGRLDTRPHIRLEPRQTTIAGVLTDESGVPVAGALRVLAPLPGAWGSCLGGTPSPGESDVPVDASGRYCLRGPTLPDSTRVTIRLSSSNFQTRPIDVALDPTRVERPRIEVSPELVQLDGRAAIVVEATTEGRAPAAGEAAELFIDCHGERTLLASARAENGRFRFSTAPSQLPGPDSCAFVVRSSIDSSPRPVVLQGQVGLRSSGWTEQGGRLRAVISVQLRWPSHIKPLTVGVLEAHRGLEHVLTVPLSDAGEGVLEVDTPPDGALSIRLTQAPPYARPAEALILAAPVPWRGWAPLQAAGLLGLAIWLAWSWLGAERRAPPSQESGAVRLPPFRKRGGTVTGRAIDLHTGRPVAATIELLGVSPTSQQVLEQAHTDSSGHFSFEVRSTGLTRLRLTADGYVAFEGLLPAGEPVIRLTERRRAAVALLAAWVRARSPAAPLPTPGEVLRTATATGRPAVARWAADVAAAAYGRTEPTDGDLSALAERKPS